MSTHNICFHRERRKICGVSILSGAMVPFEPCHVRLCLWDISRPGWFRSSPTVLSVEKCDVRHWDRSCVPSYNWDILMGAKSCRFSQHENRKKKNPVYIKKYSVLCHFFTDSYECLCCFFFVFSMNLVHF